MKLKIEEEQFSEFVPPLTLIREFWEKNQSESVISGKKSRLYSWVLGDDFIDFMFWIRKFKMTGLSLSEKIISIVIEYIFGVEIRISYEVSLMNFLLLEGILKEHSCTFYICIRTCPLFAYWTEHFVRSFVRIWIWNLLIKQIGQQVPVKVKMEGQKRVKSKDNDPGTKWTIISINGQK